MAQMREQIKILERTKPDVDKQSIRCRIQNTGYKDAQRTYPSKDLNSINKIQSEMKYMLLEIKNNLQGNNSRVIKTKNQFNDLEHKETKKQPIRTTRRKKNPKKQT